MLHKGSENTNFKYLKHNSKDLAILHVKITFPHVQPTANMILLPILLARRLLSPSQRGDDPP